MLKKNSFFLVISLSLFAIYIEIFSSEKNLKTNKLRRSRSHGALPSQLITNITNIDSERSFISQTQSPLTKRRWDLALWKACKESNIKTCTLALKNNADPNFFYEKKTALYIACKTGDFNIVRLLLNHDADICLENKKGKTPFDIVLENKNDAIISLFINYVSQEQNPLNDSYKNKITNSPRGSPSVNKDKKKFTRYIKKSTFEKAIPIGEKNSFYWEKIVLSDESISREHKNSYLKYALKIALDRYAMSNLMLSKTHRALEYIKEGVIWHSNRDQIPVKLNDLSNIKRDYRYNILQYILTHNFTDTMIQSIVQCGLERYPKLVLESLTETVFFKHKKSNNSISNTPLQWSKKNNLIFLRLITIYIKEYCNSEIITGYCNHDHLRLLIEQYYLIAKLYVKLETIKNLFKEKFLKNEELIKIIAHQYCLITREYQDLEIINTSEKEILLELITEKYAPIIKNLYKPKVTKLYDIEELLSLISKEEYIQED